MSKLWSAAAILAVVAFVGSAYAADAPKKKGDGERKRPSAEQIFKKLDGDKDGKLTVAELKASSRIGDKAEATLAKWDTDKNGTVCVKEFGAAFAKRHAERKGGEKKGDHKKKAPK